MRAVRSAATAGSGLRARRRVARCEVARCEVGGRREADPLQGIERHVDLGFVGEPVAVDASILRSLSNR